MPETPHPSRDDALHERIVRYLAGEADATDVAALNARLADDPAARRRFVTLSLHDRCLAELQQPQHAPATPDLGATPLELGDSAIDLGVTTHDLGDKARGKPSPCRATPVRTLAAHTDKPAPPKQVQTTPLLRHWQLWAAAAALVLAIPAFGIFSYIFRDTGSTPRPHTVGLGEPVAVLFETSDDAEFTFDGPGDHDNYLQTGRPVHVGIVDLKYGSLTFRFHSNAEVTLNAPARFGLNDARRAFLHEGELTAYCPEEATGFTIAAPGCVVVDLGTRFWMKVNPLGFTDVAVREGKVNLKRDNGELVSLLRGATARAPRDLADAMAYQLPVFTVAEVSVGAQLRFEEASAKLGQSYPAGRITLDHGSAVLRLSSDVAVNLTRGAQLIVHNPRRVSITHGSAEFHCPATARGFEVHLPDHARIVSRAGVFRVDTKAPHEVVISVADGQVQVDTASASSQWFPGRHGLISHGRTCQIDPILFNAADNDPARGDQPAGLAVDFDHTDLANSSERIESAFGSNIGGVEPGAVLMADGGVADNGNDELGDGAETVDYLAWRLREAVPLAGFHIVLHTDDSVTAGPRSTQMIRLIADGRVVDIFDANGHHGELTRVFPNGPIPVQRLRLELTRTTDGDFDAGPRIVEIDAITPVEAGAIVGDAPDHAAERSIGSVLPE